MQETNCLLYGGNILDKYTIKLYARARRDLDSIYDSITQNLLNSETAEEIIDALERTIFSLETFPERGAVRQVGIYANQGYRQLLVKKYIIVYRVLKKEKEVHIVTIRYAQSQF